VSTGKIRQNAGMDIRFDGFLLDLKNYSLFYQEQEISIEPQVFNLLIYLIEHREKVISRDELLAELWLGKVVSDSALSSCIKAARKALGDDAQTQKYIATLNRRGYRFVGSIDSLQGISKATNRTEDDRKDQANAGVEHSFEGNPFRVEVNSNTDKTSLALLPFNCRGKSEEDLWLSEVLSEDLSIMLANVPGFWVISHSSTETYRGKNVDVRHIGRELGVQYLVEGNLMNVRGNYRISLQLIETANNQLLWAERHEFTEDEISDIQNRIAARIVASIEPAINRAELVHLDERRKVNLNAWQLYRKSHATLAQSGWTEDSFQKSAELLRQAISLDPDMAFAHAYLSLILALGDVLGLIHEPKALEEAKQAAETAIRLDSQDSNVLGFVGCALVDLGKHERGISLLRKAVNINPSNAQALSALGAALLKIGDIDGIGWIRDGIRISPRDHRLAAWGTLLSRGLLACGKIEESIEIARDACQYDDKVYTPRVILAIACWHRGDLLEAKKAIEDAKRIRANLTVEDFLNFASSEELQGMTDDNLFL
jgi:TolB-like protein/Tfp pilus assembly protein PilF